MSVKLTELVWPVKKPISWNPKNPAELVISVELSHTNEVVIQFDGWPLLLPSSMMILGSESSPELLRAFANTLNEAATKLETIQHV